MRLALKLAGVHAFIIISLAIATWPLPLHGFPWLRYVYFVVFWTERDVIYPALYVAQLLHPDPSLEMVVYTGAFLYIGSFLLAATLQWFIIGLLFARIKGAMIGEQE